MNNKILVFGSLLCAFFGTACGSDEPGNIDRHTDEDGVECPGVEYHEDPLVWIASVVDSSSNDSLVQATFSELTFNQESRNFDDIMGGSSVMERLDISSDGRSATCTIPCGLFSAEGKYSMVVSAPTFEPKRIEFEPSYESDGGPPCRNRYSGSYELSLALEPEH